MYQSACFFFGLSHNRPFVNFIDLWQKGSTSIHDIEIWCARIFQLQYMHDFMKLEIFYGWMGRLLFYWLWLKIITTVRDRGSKSTHEIQWACVNRLVYYCMDRWHTCICDVIHVYIIVYMLSYLDSYIRYTRAIRDLNYPPKKTCVA